MVSLFSSSNGSDATYIAIRDNPKNSDLKQFAEELWTEFEPLGDTGFIKLIAANFEVRFWEMYVACALKRLGNELESADNGPDLKITNLEKTTWVEAIAPNAGTGPDAAYDGPPNSTIGVPSNEIVLRMSHAIDQKHKKYLKYIENGVVDPGDPYVIAINGHLIPCSNSADDFPTYIMKAVWPLGEDYGKIDLKTGEVVESGIRYRPKIVKRSGCSVPTTIFMDPAYEGISAIIYSRANVGNGPTVLGQDFQLLYNPYAKNPMPQGWLKTGSEIWEDDALINRKTW